MEVAVHPEALLQGADPAAAPDAQLVLRAPGMPELRVPLAAPPTSKPQIEVTVWSWTGMAEGGAPATASALLPPRPAKPANAMHGAPHASPPADEGDEAAAWLTQYIGMPVRLARYAGRPGGGGAPADDPRRREVDAQWAPPGSETAFADGFPFLLANEASGGRGAGLCC